MSESDKRPLRVALLGCGVVGTAVARMLTDNADDLAARVGRPLEIVGIAVRRPGKDRSATGVDPALFTTDAEDLVTRADVVVEVIGGIEPARSLILRAMEHGAGVVTANKALLAEDGPTLYQAAADHGVDLYYEAAVAGAIPLLRPLRESLAGDDVTPRARHRQRHHQLRAGQDGLHRRRVHRRGRARPRPWATPRPTRPPTSRASTPPPRPRSWPRWPSTPASVGKDVHREGITEVTAADVAAAREMDCVVKLLAICERTDRRWAGRRRQRPRAPGDDPADPPAGRRPRGVQRGLRRGGRGRTADVLRPRRRLATRPPRPSSATSSPWPGTGSSAAAGRGSRPTPTCRSCPMGAATTRYHISLDVAGPAGRAGPGRDGVRRPRRLDRDGPPAAALDRPGRVRRRRSRQPRRGHPHRPRRGPVGHGDALAALPTVRGVTSVMRVEGE